MNRRGFLGLLASTPVAAVLAPDLVELLAPKRTIFLPPRGGWGWRDDILDVATSSVYSNVLAPGVCLTQQSLEALLVEIMKFTQPIVVKPTRMLVHPSWTREQVEEVRRGQLEVLRRCL